MKPTHLIYCAISFAITIVQTGCVTSQRPVFSNQVYPQYPSVLTAAVIDQVTVQNHPQGQSAILNADGSIVIFYYSNGQFNADRLESNLKGATSLASGRFDLKTGSWGYVVASPSDPRVAYVAGNAIAPVYSTLGNDILPVATVAGDFNRDGSLDLAVLDTNGNVDVCLGNGDGSFKPASQTFKVGAATCIACASLRSKSPNLDLITSGSGDVDVLLGNGDGSFQAPQYVNGYGYFGGTPANHPGRVLVKDFNGDGFQDLAVLGTYSNNVGILFGTDDGIHYNSAQFYAVYPPVARGVVADMAAGDFNGDGVQDLAITVPDGQLIILVGNKGGSFQGYYVLPDTEGAPAGKVWSPNAIAAGHFYGSQRDDLLVLDLFKNPGLNAPGSAVYGAWLLRAQEPEVFWRFN
ncbi:MAG TPA: VCBS repeat-containing protein [Opitutaceae bacterium]|nr:VCBS repeat-containing protein [Opitutaceae bacterium]